MASSLGFDCVDQQDFMGKGVCAHRHLREYHYTAVLHLKDLISCTFLFALQGVNEAAPQHDKLAIAEQIELLWAAERGMHMGQAWK